MDVKEIMNIMEMRKAADRGAIYLLLFVGGVLFVGVDPTEFVIGPSRALTGPEFITVNVIGAALLIAAGVLSLLVSRATLRALETVSKISASPAEKTLEALNEAAKQMSAYNAGQQKQIVEGIMEAMRINLGQPPLPPAAGPTQ